MSRYASNWLLGWTEIASGVVTVITFGMVRPMWIERMLIRRLGGDHD